MIIFGGWIGWLDLLRVGICGCAGIMSRKAYKQGVRAPLLWPRVAGCGRAGGRWSVVGEWWALGLAGGALPAVDGWLVGWVNCGWWSVVGGRPI